MEKHKSCSFFGHRTIEINDILKEKIISTIEKLITKYKIQNFLFGSKSDFNDLCHLVVSELKAKYPNIKRICYTCKSESFTLESDREHLEKVYFKILNTTIHLLGFEEEVEHKTKYSAGKASYIERNQAMINDSDFCIFYYDENYIPSAKTNSGTKTAYNYALQKKKNIINLF